MRNVYKIQVFLITFFILMFPLIPVVASCHQGGGNDPGGGNDEYCITIDNPLKSGNDTLQEFIETVLRDVVMPIGAVIAVLFIVYAGFLYVTAQGSEEKIATAHRALLYAVIGTAILLGAWVISKGIASTINQIAAP